jgi:hypothetical protein
LRDLNHEFDRADGTLIFSRDTTGAGRVELNRRPVPGVQRRGPDSGIEVIGKSIEMTRAGRLSEA